MNIIPEVKMGKKNISDQNQSNYKLLDDGSFVIENYNQTKSFSSFFPGIAGLNGIPMWAFYINRNQGIASFGIRNKNYSIMEFYPANTSYALTANMGFRTFIKIKKNNGTEFYEPFRDNSTNIKQKITQKMYVRFYEVIFEDINETLGIKTLVRYFTIPNEPIAAMARMVEFTNLSKEKLSIEVIDGLPKIIPYWMDQGILKSMSHTAQAWTTVTNLNKEAPFYKLKVEINDSPEVKNLNHGNFYFGFEGVNKKYKKIKPIVDPEIIFRQDLSYSMPINFVLENNFAVSKDQFGDNKYPSAMGWFKADISPSEKHNVNSIIGYIENEQKLNEFCKKASKGHYFDEKSLENQNLISGLLSSVETNSSMKIFDMYCKQTYLDNLMRGGMPIVIPGRNKKTVFYVYSRKHGDLERDYNNFELSPLCFSQGNGNYRDMNQNKRSDVFINPNIEDFNVLSFYNLIQLDGYNPLLIKGQRFYFNAISKIGEQILKKLVKGKYRPKMREFFADTFEPGSLLLFLKQNNIGLSVPKEKFLTNMLESSNSINSADHCEGFWTDHWTYNMDLLESYLSIYPEKKHEILFEKSEFTFYDNAHYVVPRSEKYVNSNGKVRQFGSVIKSKEKEKLISGRQSDINIMRTTYGKGSVYRTTLLAKMICLILNKFATLDCEGIGIEMEADKPSWYDALNGLPGVFGSSVPETFELKRNMQFIVDYLSKKNISPIYEISVAEEIYDFFYDLENILKKSSKYSPFSFWDNASTVKEKYRKRTLYGVSGKEKILTVDHLLSFMNMAIKKIDKGLAKAFDRKTGLYYTYYTHEAKKYVPNQKINKKGLPCVKINSFKKHPLPLFLEAEVHYIKTEPKSEKIKKLHKSLKKSELYDKNLNMYKVNASLKNESTDIGRCTVFTSGWLENESIWLHMEYKYILELLKAGLYKEYFEEFKKICVCFQDPQVYGRSLLENSSFIASSAFPDKSIWGRGFVARLSGSTAEFIQMWLLMTCGATPFTIDENRELVLEFKPTLSKEFFTKEGNFSFKFLGGTIVRYKNTQRIDTFSNKIAINKIVIRWDDGTMDYINGAKIIGPKAKRIRAQEAKEIEVFF